MGQTSSSCLFDTILHIFGCMSADVTFSVNAGAQLQHFTQKEDMSEVKALSAGLLRFPPPPTHLFISWKRQTAKPCRLLSLCATYAFACDLVLLKSGLPWNVCSWDKQYLLVQGSVRLDNCLQKCHWARKISSSSSDFISSHDCQCSACLWYVAYLLSTRWRGDRCRGSDVSNKWQKDIQEL